MFLERLTELMNLKCNGKQVILAKDTGIAQGTISCYFTRGSMPSAEQLIILADYFNVSVDYILGREDDFGIVKIKNELTTGEETLLGYYRKLNEHDQHKVLGFIQALAF